MNVVRLTKHHAVGNDFLVLLDDGGAGEVGPDHARAWCHRHTGIGADGLIIVTSGTDGADVTMTLFNADGTIAEISGNGIRCLGQAVAMDRGLVELDLTVASGSGLRTLHLGPGTDDRSLVASVDMGMVRVPRVRPTDTSDNAPGHDGPAGSAHVRSLSVEVGNPHTVLLYDDPVERDRVADALGAGTSNVELVLAGSAPDAIAMRVIERGVGETLACGSGACAAAYATRAWGITGDRVRVAMPGGEVSVDLGGDTVVLTGPTVYVASVEIPVETPVETPWP